MEKHARTQQVMSCFVLAASNAHSINPLLMEDGGLRNRAETPRKKPRLSVGQRHRGTRTQAVSNSRARYRAPNRVRYNVTKIPELRLCLESETFHT